MNMIIIYGALRSDGVIICFFTNTSISLIKSGYRGNYTNYVVWINLLINKGSVKVSPIR